MSKFTSAYMYFSSCFFFFFFFFSPSCVSCVYQFLIVLFAISFCFPFFTPQCLFQPLMRLDALRYIMCLFIVSLPAWFHYKGAVYPSCNAILGILHGIRGKRTKQTTSWEVSSRVGMRAELRMKSLKQSIYLSDWFDCLWCGCLLRYYLCIVYIFRYLGLACWLLHNLGVLQFLFYMYI